MYLDCFKNYGKPYLRVVHNFYHTDNGKLKQRRVTLKNLGLLSNYDDGKPDLLKRLREQFKNGELVDLSEFDLTQFKKDKDTIPAKDINLKLNPKNIGYLFLNQIYHDLGIDTFLNRIKADSKIEYDLNGLTKLLVFERILNPQSKKKTFENKNRYLFPITTSTDLNDIYKVLDVLDKNSKKIQNRMNTKIKNSSIGRVTNLTYYDCTNYFFYTEENDFQRYGISKQHQPHPLVQMGLFMDADGYPFAMNINPGNTSETKTMIPTEKEFLKNYNMKGSNIIICTDAAMCTDEIKKFNIKDGRGFIITQSIKKLNDELQKFVFDKSGWRILGNLIDIYNLENIEKDEDLKKKYYNTIFYKEIECETKSVEQTLIVTFSFKYQAYQHKLKTHQLERARKIVEEANRKNKTVKKKNDIEKIKLSKNPNDPKRFVKEIKTTNTGELAYNIQYMIDEEIYKNEEKYNGYYGITTNLIDDTATIIKVKNGRWEIEESFRIMKDDFDSGTVHLSREDRIKGHFITCFLALFIYRYLEHKLNDKYTVSEIISKLQEMKLLEHKGKGFEPIQTRDDLTDDLHKFLGIKTDTEIITYKKIKKIFE